ncbi:MAG: GAF domain-containing SpoIIE family protein phosphatase [Longimicrobiales bacterium]|nr:GAF domain-containing SpoIIE family protein phosphatase [Longimicrobiales bacterium]
MTDILRAQRRRLPASVTRLVDRYVRSHEDAEIRLWRRYADGWECVYPASVSADGGPKAEDRIVLEDTGYGALELELGGGGEREDAAFLAAALRQVLTQEEEARSAAHELSERYEEINLLYSIAEILASFLSMEKATTRILQEVTDVLGARRAALWVLDPAFDCLELKAEVGEEGLEGPIPIDDPTSVTARVFRERQPVNLEQGDQLPDGLLREPRPRGEEPYLSVPVNYTPPDGGSRTVGVITLVGRRTDVRFSAGDLRLLTAIASQVAAALETQRLVQESLRRERMEREMELAHDLQLKLLPDAARFAPDARLAARCVPADSVGGDLYHLFELPDGCLGVVIADVSSHGFSAALIMALTMSAIAIYAQEARQPGEALRRIHESLIDELQSTEMYLTIFFGVADPDKGELTWANAGHPHAFMIRGGGTAERLSATSPPLGTFTFPAYGEDSVPWGDAGDLLFLFTDGLSDAFSGTSGIAGEDALVDEVTRLRDREPGEILDRLFEAAEEAGNGIPPDDRTAVLLRS